MKNDLSLEFTDLLRERHLNKAEKQDLAPITMSIHKENS